ncbi:hypothetical protein LCGC14_2610950 [marine sediment metagenome]|uniref:Uncharacterized protein n=1 Tax=marine sediment metagenome TaxID=412755 RepID=A0A0F9A5W6_9ZZZZ
MPTYAEMRAQPPFREPLVDKDGRLTRPWLAWFQGQFKKLGGPTDTAPINIEGLAANATNAVTALTAATAQDATSAAYVYTPANALTSEDRGGSLGAKIIIVDTTFDWVDLKSVGYTGGADLLQDDLGADLAYATQYFVYTDDPNRSGGAVTWKATTDYLKLNNVGRWHLGAVVTAIDGGGATSGGGDGGGGGLGRIEKYGF